MPRVTHSYVPTGVDNGGGYINKNTWNEDHTIVTHGAQISVQFPITTTIAAAGYTPPSFYEDIDYGVLNFDTDGYVSLGKHTASYTLTGTASTTAGSKTVTGTGTLFTTECPVGTQISIVETVTPYRRVLGTVTSVTSNTSLQILIASPLTISGSLYRQCGWTIPTGLAGYYLLATTTSFAPVSGGYRLVQGYVTRISTGTNEMFFHATCPALSYTNSTYSNATQVSASGILYLNVGDLVAVASQSIDSASVPKLLGTSPDNYYTLTRATLSLLT